VGDPLDERGVEAAGAEHDCRGKLAGGRGVPPRAPGRIRNAAR
jgi:hypothetical protein